MLFKDKRVEWEYHNGGIHIVVVWFLALLDALARLWNFFHPKNKAEIKITCLLGKEIHKDGYHPEGQAVDLSHDKWPTGFAMIVGAFGVLLKQLSGGQIQHVIEKTSLDSKGNRHPIPHDHWEYDDDTHDRIKK